MDPASVALELHSPEELVFLSNIGHWAIGVLLLVVAIVAFSQALGRLRGSVARYVWPSLILIAGASLPLMTFIHHATELPLLMKAFMVDMQQLQHMVMAILLVIAGIAEIAYLRGRTALRFVFPAALGIIGVLFLVHPQHGTSEAVAQAAVIHRYLGAAILLAAFFRVMEVAKKSVRWLRFPWIAFTIVAALLLISYREPAGAYEIPEPGVQVAPVSESGMH